MSQPVPRQVGLLAPMRSELRPLVRRLSLESTERDGEPVYRGRVGDTAVVATLAGVGTGPASAATERLLELGGGVDHVVIVGIAGGIDPALAIGDLITPETVIHDGTGAEHRPTTLGSRTPRDSLLTSDEVLLDPAAHARLVERGVVALDMETAAVGAVCEERGCPWSVFRAVSDRAEDGLVDEAIGGLAKPDGSADLPAVARYLASHPLRARRLARLGRDMKTAANAAAGAAARELHAWLG